MNKNNFCNLKIIFQGKKFIGNNKHILIEQLENQGFIIPYYCRAGICGECKLQLISGPILPSSIKKYILSCCYIPTRDIEII
ncbi:MAG: 2Fe-2S iron-sulfur cluster binding domain-containing protein [Candidatus Dasytiphilus stammeri]